MSGAILCVRGREGRRCGCMYKDGEAMTIMVVKASKYYPHRLQHSSTFFLTLEKFSVSSSMFAELPAVFDCACVLCVCCVCRVSCVCVCVVCGISEDVYANIKAHTIIYSTSTNNYHHRSLQRQTRYQRSHTHTSVSCSFDST